jgi:hypothetical protein
LFWYCDHFSWYPAIKTIDDAPDAEADEYEKVIVAFVHVEPKDVDNGNTSETKLVKNAKWLARKWDITKIVLHSFTHLGEEKAEADKAQKLLHRAQDRLENAGYITVQTPYGYFLDLSIKAQGHPLARIYKEFK